MPIGSLCKYVVKVHILFRAVGGNLVHGSPSQADEKRVKRSHMAKKFSVAISYATKIPLKSVALALRGSESEHAHDALRVLDIVLRQQQAKRYDILFCHCNNIFRCLVTMYLLFVLYRGCLLVRQSFFSDDNRNLVDLTGGVSGCRGLHSSFRTTIGGLSLNMGMHFNTYNWILIQIANIDIIIFRLHRCFNHYDCHSWTSY